MKQRKREREDGVFWVGALLLIFPLQSNGPEGGRVGVSHTHSVQLQFSHTFHSMSTSNLSIIMDCSRREPACVARVGVIMYLYLYCLTMSKVRLPINAEWHLSSAMARLCSDHDKCFVV